MRIRETISQPFKDLYNSFKTTDGGFSARKLAAFCAVVASMYVTVKHTDTSNLVGVLEVLLLFALLCLGLVTFGDIVAWRTGRTKETVKETVKQTEKTTESNSSGDTKTVGS